MLAPSETYFEGVLTIYRSAARRCEFSVNPPLASLHTPVRAISI
jgi:hypothetical protein